MKKTIFVIMPFVKTPMRDEAALTSFFSENLKKPIENENFGSTEFVVKRLDDTFNISKQIIFDLYSSDYVICDLSGELANPNVMYELGVRLAISNKPVILIRESNPNNHKIFDVVGFHTQEYSPLRYSEIEEYIKQKLRKFESKEEVFQSPVLDILSKEPGVLRELMIIETLDRLSMAQVAVNSWRKILAVYVVSYATSLDQEIKFSMNIETFNEELKQNQSRMEKLDWSKLDFSLNTSPAFDALLIQPPSFELFPALELSLFKTHINEFHHFFFATNESWNKMSLDKIIIFSVETLIVWSLIDRIKAYIGPSSYSESDMIKEFHELISHSIILRDFLNENPHNRR